ncbi:UNVERIFIED_ORG: hypothetical protein J2W64_002908 [Rahnella aquatilis]|nr:hypothetical protein [Rahnella aquatilis]
MAVMVGRIWRWCITILAISLKSLKISGLSTEGLAVFCLSFITLKYKPDHLAIGLSSGNRDSVDNY